MVEFGLPKLLRFSKGGPGDIEKCLNGGQDGDYESAAEIGVTIDSRADLVTITDDRTSLWKRRMGTLKRVVLHAPYKYLLTLSAISEVWRRHRTSDQSLDHHHEADQSAIEPEPSTSGEFDIGLDELVQLVKGRSTEALRKYDEIEVNGLLKKLKTDLKKGIDRLDEAILLRRLTFGSNTYPCRKGKTFWCFLWRAIRQFPNLLVIMLAAVYFLLKLIDTKGVLDGWYDRYVEAFIILPSVFDIIVRAITEYKQSCRFEKLTEEERNVLDVIRGGRTRSVSIYDIVVGDIVLLVNGCEVPADGILLVADSLKVDEQEITGSEEHVQKDLERNPFLLSGSEVIEGKGTMLVTSVGKNTEWWLKMEKIPHENEEDKPFQGYLNCLTIAASWLVVFVASVACIIQSGRYFSGQTKKSDSTQIFVLGNTSARETTEFVIKSLRLMIATIIVALPTGISIAVCLNLAKTTGKMMTDNILVQTLSACERMGSVTNIVCHKTGILTSNQMSVDDVWAGDRRMQKENDFSLLGLVPSLNELIIEGIAQNTNGDVVFERGVNVPELFGSPTEQAILSFGNKLGMKFGDARSASSVRRTIPFNPENKYGGVTLRKLGELDRAHWKGSAKVILTKCNEYMDGANNPRAIDEQKRKFFEGIIDDMCNKRLRCAALAYQTYKLGSLPISEELSLIPEDLVLLAIIGIKDPCRSGTRNAIELCNSGSVQVCMVTDDDVLTAQAIAMDCGILRDASGDNIMTGAEFRDLTEREQKNIANNLLVLAESSPRDNLLLVETLKSIGRVVAATGKGIHDTKTLLEADVSLAMGIGGTRAAKEKSDIIILDDNFATIFKCIIWSRSLYTNVQRSILFRLTVSVSALGICVVEVVLYDAFPLNTVQLLFLNLVIDILGALALAYRPIADGHLMGKPPVGIRDPLITKTMWSKLTIQAVYLVLTLSLLKSEELLKLKHGHTGNDEQVMNTFIFNCFVFYLVFNEFEIQSIDHSFKYILRENMFLVTVTSTIISQIILMELAGIFVPSFRLDLIKLARTSLLGLLSQLATRFPYPANQYYRN